RTRTNGWPGTPWCWRRWAGAAASCSPSSPAPTATAGGRCPAAGWTPGRIPRPACCARCTRRPGRRWWTCGRWTWSPRTGRGGRRPGAWRTSPRGGWSTGPTARSRPSRWSTTLAGPRPPRPGCRSSSSPGSRWSAGPCRSSGGSPEARVSAMETLYDLIVVTHLLGMAALVGGYLVAATRGGAAVVPNGVMLWGARLQVVTGLVLAGLVEQVRDEPNYTKIGIKLVVALVVVALT